MKPFKNLVKQYRKWRFNQMKRDDTKIDQRVITSCEEMIKMAPSISPEYVLRLKIYKTLSEEALKTNNPTHYYNIRGLQANIITLFKEELNTIQNTYNNPANDNNRPRPGVA